MKGSLSEAQEICIGSGTILMPVTEYRVSAQGTVYLVSVFVFVCLAGEHHSRNSDR